MSKYAAPLFVFFLAAAPAAAGPLDAGLVAADARWMMHLDVEALRQDPMVRQLRDRHLQDEGARARHEKMKQWLGLESWDDLAAVLMYGTAYEKGEGVVIIEAKVDQAAVVKRLKDKPNYRAEEDGSHTVHVWTYETRRKGAVKEHHVYLMFYPGHRAVMSRHRDQFDAAIAVLDGAAPTLGAEDARLRGNVPDGASFYAEVAGPVPHGGKHGAWIKRMHHLMFAMIHGDSTMTMRMTLDAGDAEAAGHLQKMCEGFVAMMRLRHADEDGPASDIMDDLRFNVDGSVMRINWTVPHEAAARMIERHARKHHHHRRHRHKKDADTQ